MRSQRILWFFVMIGLGAGLGLIYGWVLRPPNQSGAAPSSLRADYKTDYALMTAEIFDADGDLTAAQNRLAILSSDSPAAIMNEAVKTARELDYPQADLAFMEALLQQLQAPAGSQP